MPPDERAVVLASKSKRLSEATKDEIKDMLLRIYQIIGLPPDKWVGRGLDSDSYEVKKNKQLTRELIYKDLRTLPATMDEVIESFRMACFGFTKYDPIKRTGFDLNLYDKLFSFAYISGCFAEWKRYSIEVMKSYKNQLAQPSPDKTLTKQEQEEANLNSFNGLINFVQEKKEIPLVWKWEQCFFVAERKGLIADTKEEKGIFMEEVREQIKEEVEDDKEKLTPRAFKSLVENNLSENNLIFQCRKRRLILYLKTKYALY